MRRDRSASGLLRIALPPGVSVLVHALLIGVFVVIGSQLAPSAEPTRRIALSETGSAPMPALPDQPERVRDDANPSAPDADSSARESSLPQTSAAFERAARSLTDQSTAQRALPGVIQRDASSPIGNIQVSSGVRFAGYRAGAAGAIVYCVDVSGPTASSLTYIRERLLQSIDLLSATQRFQVVVFRDLGDVGYELAPLDASPLARATRANKDAVAQWLGKMPAMGRSNPLDGLRAAIELDPDLILLISRAIERTNDDPWAGGLNNVRRTLEELNPMDAITGNRDIVIKTVQLIDEDPTNIMRAIGTLHGDGANDHSVVRYEALASPDRTVTSSVASSALPGRAGAILNTLGSTGTTLRAAIGAPTTNDRSVIRANINDLRAIARELDPSDASTMMLTTQISVLASAIGDQSPPAPRTLRTQVFVDPDADAHRRLAIAQLDALLGDTDIAASAMRSILDEREQLGLSDDVAAQTLVSLVSLGIIPDASSSIINASPFVRAGRADKGWTLMLAWSRAIGAARSSTPSSSPLDNQGIYAPLLNLSAHGFSVDEIADAVYEMSLLAPDAPRPDPVRLILAREAMRDSSTRRDATDEALEIGTQNPDNAISAQALWIACLGAQSDARDDVLIQAAAVMSDRHPQDPRTLDALSGAIRAARQKDTAVREALLRRALTLSTDRPEQDLWTLDLAGLVDDPAERRSLVASLTPETRESDLGAALVDEDAKHKNFSDPNAQLAYTLETLELFKTLGSPLASSWEQRAALLEVGLDPSSAVERLSLVRNPSPEVSLALAQALVNAARPSDATETLSELVSRLDARDPAFWNAWALLIEIAVEHGDKASRDAARAHLSRLEIIDPDFGGASTRSRLTNARRTLHSEP